MPPTRPDSRNGRRAWSTGIWTAPARPPSVPGHSPHWRRCTAVHLPGHTRRPTPGLGCARRRRPDPGDRRPHRRTAYRPRRSPLPGPGQRGARNNVRANMRLQSHGHTESARKRQHSLRVHRLDVPRAECRHGNGPLRRMRCAHLDVTFSRAHHGECALLSSLRDRVDLDRVRQVVGEEHHRGQAHEQQQDRPAHRETRKLLNTSSRRHADRVKPGGAVGERRDEDAQHDLIRAIAEKVAQKPRRELR